MTSGSPPASRSSEPPQDAATSAATTMASPRSTEASLEAPPAEVGAKHRFVLDDLVDGPLGDLPAGLEHGHPVGNAPDEPEVVLHEHDRQTARGQVADELGEQVDLGSAGAGRRLVEQEHRPAGGERGGDHQA